MHAVIYCDIMHNGKRMEAIQISREGSGWTHMAQMLENAFQYVRGTSQLCLEVKPLRQFLKQGIQNLLKKTVKEKLKSNNILKLKRDIHND